MTMEGFENPVLDANAPTAQNQEAEVQKKLNSFLDHGSLDDAFAVQELVSAIKMLVDRGKIPEDLFMRANFADDAQAVDATRIIAKATMFHAKIVIDEVHATIATRVSIKGNRIGQLVSAITGGQQNQQQRNQGGTGDWLKRKAGLQ